MLRGVRAAGWALCPDTYSVALSPVQVACPTSGTDSWTCASFARDEIVARGESCW